jgi:hypothetical protein
VYLSAELLALANQTVLETFEQCSVAWQAIPHWDTGDPGQARVRNDIVNAPGFLPLDLKNEDFQVTVVQANAPTPDSLLAEVMLYTARLAAKVDDDVLPKLYAADTSPVTTATGDTALLNTLIDARASVEKAGYRAPSCLLTNTEGLKKLSQLVSGYSILEQLLVAANINSLYRAETLDAGTDFRLVMLGRRQRIAHGSAAEALPGEEPVDLAVSVLPSLEVVGETSTGDIEVSVRIRYATRIKDATGLYAVKT